MGILHKIARGRRGAGRAFTAAVVSALSLGLGACRDDKPPPPAPPPPKALVAWPKVPPAVIAYQGGVGYAVFGSVPNIRDMIGKVGVNAVHVPVVLTHDLTPVVWPETRISGSRCAVAEPDPQSPDQTSTPPGAIGSLVHDLTIQDVRGLVCDQLDPLYPSQSGKPNPGNKISPLVDVLKVGSSYDKWDQNLWFDIELVTDPVAKQNTATPEQYVAAVFKAIGDAQYTNVTISSYDWSTLPIVHNGTTTVRGNPAYPTIALVRSDTFYPGSPWLGDVKVEKEHGDLVDSVSTLGADGVGPDFLASAGLPPAGNSQRPSNLGLPLLVTKDFVTRSHAAGLRVFPRVINDTNTIQQQLRICVLDDSRAHWEQGVDGIVTAYPDVLGTAIAGLGGSRPPTLNPR